MTGPVDRQARAVVLLYPLTGNDLGIGVAPPHSVLSVGAYLKEKGIPNRIRIIDQRTDRNWKRTLLEELAKGPLLTGISSMTGVQLRHALDAAAFVRQHSPATTVVFGGVHVSLLPEQSVRSDLMDLCVVGEGELTMLELVSCLNEDRRERIEAMPGIAFRTSSGQAVVNAKRPAVDMDTLPLDRFSLVDAEPYIFSKYSFFTDRELDIGETSRGCCWDCGYCYNTVFHGRKWHAMSAARAIELVTQSVRRFGLKSIWIRDDNFFVNMDRAAEIIGFIARQNLKLYIPGITVQEFRRLPQDLRKDLQRIGGTMFRFGIESGSDRILSLIDKGITVADIHAVNRECREQGIIPSYNLMIGFPRETREDVLATVGLTRELRRENPQAQLNSINLFTPYPGTKLYRLFCEDFPGDVPKDIAGWTSFHHQKLKKGRVDRAERRYYENIAEISILISDVWYSTLSGMLKLVFRMIRPWFRLRWERNAFAFAPEILAVRLLKKWLLRAG